MKKSFIAFGLLALCVGLASAASVAPAVADQPAALTVAHKVDKVQPAPAASVKADLAVASQPSSQAVKADYALRPAELGASATVRTSTAIPGQWRHLMQATYRPEPGGAELRSWRP
ncbi:hypothetical protein [Rhodoferax sp.]|uniref:hypothetical protein n=1 Tax=Rhodoferax sp. TaxID=50421 RepID=UPI00374DFADB